MSFLQDLGIDPEAFTWEDLATCSGTDTEIFFSEYESKPSIRPAVDALCASCPVRRECLLDGLENKQYGVRGGWYLNGSGNIDKMYTKHKTAADREELKELIIGGREGVDDR